MSSSVRNIKFILPPTAPLRYKTAAFNFNTKIIDVLDKLTDLCHFVNFAESGYGLYIPKGHGSSRGTWLDNDKSLAEYPNYFEDSIELRKRPGFRSNPTSPSSPGAIPAKEGNALRYSPLTRLWTPCILRLYTHKLAICSSEHDNNPDLILLANVTKVGQTSEKKYAFFVSVEDTRSTFRCRNNTVMLDWIKTIGESVLEVNPEFDFNVSEYIPVVSPRTRATSFLNILSREDTSSLSTIPERDTTSLTGSGGISPRPTLSPREEKKKYSFLTLRNNKKSSSKEKEGSMFNLRSSKGVDKEKEKEKERPGRRKHSSTVSNPSSPTTSPPLLSLSSSSSISSTVSNPSSPTSPPSSPPISPNPDMFPYLDDEMGRARSHSTSTTNIPTIPTIQSLLAAKRISTNEAEIHMLREKLQHQTDYNRQMEQKYQNLLLKYTEQANKSSLKNTTGPLIDASVAPLTTSLSLPALDQEKEKEPSSPLRKSSSMLWRWSRKSEPEVLELKLELQQLKAENRVMKLQLDRRADRDSKVLKQSSERKRTSPRSRRQLREGLEKEKSLGRLETRARRDSGNLTPSTSENDLFMLTGIRNRSDSEAGVRSRSASVRSENDDVDIFLRDSIRHDYSVPLSPTIHTSASQDFSELSRSRSNTVGGAGMSDIEALQKEMASLREKLLEQQQLFRREETNRLHIEREYRKNNQADENALLDMESIARVLQQSLSQLKQKLEDEYGEYSDEDDNE